MSRHPSAEPDSATAAGGVFAVICALPEELGQLALRPAARCSRQGLELLEIELGAVRLRACVAGVGKVRAAQAATLLLEPGDVAALFVVGTCGALSPGLGAGELVHCTRAVQVDFALRGDREQVASEAWTTAWRAVAPGPRGSFLTADRPVITWWRRRKLALAYPGTAVADMETAAAGGVCARAGVPWAALRAVTDGANPWTYNSFQRNLPIQGPRAADTLQALLQPGSDLPEGT